ncbi:MAG: deoxyribose-phosphate aldolase [Muribaculaceae bacterium]|nr:deoxyribose-phosphate aldolase [Muribaculaceae bacterium]
MNEHHHHDHDCDCGCHHHEEEAISRYDEVVEQSQVPTGDEQVSAEVQKILAAHEQENHSPEVYQFLLNCVDLTTLNTDDSEHSVAEFVTRVNTYAEAYPHLKNVAAVCVYSNFATIARANLEVSDVNIAVCSACFPSSQAHLETKIAETALAIQDGADEVDVVLNVGYFRDKAWQELCDEIYELKQTIGQHHLKVILETGLLKTAENIRRASILAMYSGADFIKTSTGKGYLGATLEAAYVMCRCIKEFYERTGLVVGFKASGGIRTTDDAVRYYTIVKEVLGEEWLTNERFRIGASSLANALFASFSGLDVKPF